MAIAEFMRCFHFSRMQQIPFRVMVQEWVGPVCRTIYVALAPNTFVVILDDPWEMEYWTSICMARFTEFTNAFHLCPCTKSIYIYPLNPLNIPFIYIIYHIYLSSRLQVFRAKWFMAHYGGLSAKPHYAWGNSPHLSRLCLGPLLGRRAKQPYEGPLKVKTCKTYKNKNGETCYTGNSNLRKSELLSSSQQIPSLFWGRSSFMLLGFEIPWSEDALWGDMLWGTTFQAMW